MNTIILLAALALGADPQDQPAAQPPPGNIQDLNRLVTLRRDIEMVEQLRLDGFDVDKDGKLMKSLLDQVKTTSGGRASTYDELVLLTGGGNAPPTPWEQFKGLVTFTNCLWVLGIVFAGTAAIWLFGHYFLALILMVPGVAWEVILWLGFSVLAWSATNVSPDWQLAVLMPAAFGFLGATVLTCKLHGSESNRYEVPSAMLMIVWGILAVCFGSHVLGFMSVMAALSALGFICGHLPGVVYIGFDREDLIPRATFAAGLMLSAHILFTVTGAAATQIAVFREGMNFMGSFVYYLGILCLACRYYTWERDENGWKRTRWPLYWMMQGVVLVSGLSAFYFGTVFGMTALLGFGGTFFCLYILEKYYELPWKGVGWAWSLLGLGGLLYGMGLFIKTHPQYFLFGG
jgi:hypothetical protein